MVYTPGGLAADSCKTCTGPVQDALNSYSFRSLDCPNLRYRSEDLRGKGMKAPDGSELQLCWCSAAPSVKIELRKSWLRDRRRAPLCLEADSLPT